MYKILYNNITIDVMRKITYCRYLQRSGCTILTDPVSANCIVSSNGSEVYHIAGTPPMPEGYKSVTIVQIDKEEYEYLTSLIARGEPVEADLLKAREDKIAEMSIASRNAIYAGTDITLSDGVTYHFSFTDQDQSQIGLLTIAAKTAAMLQMIGQATNETGKDYPWHPDGGDCIFYSREDMIKIGTTMQNYITYQNSYFHALRNYIQSMNNTFKISEITYGIEVPKIYCGDVYQTVLSEDNH